MALPDKEVQADEQDLIKGLTKKVQKYNKKADKNLIKQAFEFAYRAHTDQYRRSGEQYILHPLGVAEILASLEMDTTTIAAALLHDVVEDTSTEVDELREKFGDEIAALVDGVTKLSRISYKKTEDAQAKSLRKMLVAMAKDVRVIIIKLADRLHNMRTLSHLTSAKQKQKAQETMEVYAPIAHRLGMHQIKAELEDLSFLNLHPKRYAEIIHLVAEKSQQRDKYLENVMDLLRKEVKKARIKADIGGRAKSYYSIYRKMVEDNLEFDQIYDLIAVRVIVEDIKDCYAALGVIHSLFKPIPGRFKDYIAMPKFNMYQSIHTTVIGPQGRHLEIQVRSWDMHRTSEYGIAAHWRYKEKEKERDEFEERLAWLRQMLDWQSDVKDPREFMEALKIDLLENEVFVFTPTGQVLSFPRGATPIDFAFTIHTDVGNQCVGSKVNGQIVPLEYELKSGDTVEIITSKTSSGPSRDWLNIVKTTRARNKIKHWFAKEQKSMSQQAGKELLRKAMRKHGVSVQKAMKHDILLDLAKKYNYERVDDLFASIGSGVTSPRQVATRLVKKLTGQGEQEKEPQIEPITSDVGPEVQMPIRTAGVRVKGIKDVLIKLSRCCNPVPPDAILGFVTRGRGVTVHRKDCPNARELLKDPERFIDVSWAEKLPASFPVEVKVEALDRTKLLRDITTVVGEYDVNILSAAVVINKDHVATTRLIFEVGNLDMLNDVLMGMKKINGVFDAYRVLPS